MPIPALPVVEEWLRHKERNTQIVRLEDADGRRVSLRAYQEDDPVALAQWLRQIADQLPLAQWTTL